MSIFNGAKKRLLHSWIDAFVRVTEPIGTPEIFRRWTAIATIAAALEQKVWLQTTSPLFPNLYTFLVAHPGVGKTRIIRIARQLLQGIPELHIGAVSLTWAALVDNLFEAKRFIPREEPIEYNSMAIVADELGAFIHAYEPEMIDGLSAMYDTDPYSQRRRTTGLRIEILKPQLNILCGVTPQALMNLLPDRAWGQGFASRLLMIFTDERIIVDDFAKHAELDLGDLSHDLTLIYELFGEFHVTEGYAKAIHEWRLGGEKPAPSHPRLLHYATRRKVHIYKLSMVASIDRSDGLVLTKDEFDTALAWLLEAEALMPDIFKAGVCGAEQMVINEILNFIKINGTITSDGILRTALKQLPAQTAERMLKLMLLTKYIKPVGRNLYTINVEASSPDLKSDSAC